MRIVVVVGMILTLAAGTRADDIAYSLEAVGQGSQYLAVGVTAFELSSSSPRERAFGSELSRSLAYTLAATEILKYATHQPRPCNPDAGDGFPSGHTAVAFAFAETLTLHDRNWAIPAFTVAALTGYSRVQKGAHDPWQVVAGAVLGFFVAQEVAQGNHWEW